MSSFDLSLAYPDQVIFNAAFESLRQFWQQAPYRHFTNHGVEHAERVLRKSWELQALLPRESRLRKEEQFVLALSALLYDAGMQNPRLSPVLDFDWRPGEPLTWQQLEQIRSNCHLLSSQLLQDSLNGRAGRKILALPSISDEVANACAQVIQRCAAQPVGNVLDVVPLRGDACRVQLLAAILRVADQLYLDQARINWELLSYANLPTEQAAYWWTFQYVRALPLSTNRIPFYYRLPDTQPGLYEPLRRYIEHEFDDRHNMTVRYLFNHGAIIVPGNAGEPVYEAPGAYLREAPREVAEYYYEVALGYR